MIYKFKSKAAGDLIMLAPQGDQILRLMGKEPGPKGIVEVLQMAAAIQAIEQAVADDEAQRARAEAEAEAAGQAPPHRAGHISLRQRSWPMLEMLKRALEARQDIVWGV